MLFRSFAHWLLIIFGSVVLVVCLLVAAELNLLGPTAHAWVASAADEASRIYGIYGREIDFAAKVIGATGTAVGAAWTVYKGWHYAESNLPRRIEDAAFRRKQATVDGRPATIAALAAPLIDLPERSEAYPLLRWWRWIHDPAKWAVASGHDRVDSQSKDLKILTAGRVNCRAALVSSHLELGAAMSFQHCGIEALEVFRKAVRLDRSDADALELAGRQAFALKRMSVAQGYFSALADVCVHDSKVERRLRAMRFQAEALKSGTPAEQVQARNLLKAVIAILTQPNALDGVVRSRELCLAQGQLADVQTIRNTLHSARSAFSQASAWLNQLDQASGSAIRKWLKDIDARLTQAECDRDLDNESDEDGDGDGTVSDPPKPGDGAA